MAKFPAMPWWTDAYLADCGHLDDAEHGRYLMILIHLWRAPGQRFPNDDVWLARKFRRSVEEVRAELRPLIKEFCSSDGNWITQGRLKREFAYVSASSARQSVRAKLRWDKEKGISSGNAGSGNAPTPTPTPIKRETKVSQKKGSRLKEDWTLPSPWGQWALEQGLVREVVLSQADRFKDYWLSKPGQAAVKIEWERVWRNWIRTKVEGVFTNGGPSKPREQTASDHIMRELSLDGEGKTR